MQKTEIHTRNGHWYIIIRPSIHVYMVICIVAIVCLLVSFNNIYPALTMAFFAICILIAKKNQKIEIEGKNAIITTLTGITKINDIESISCRIGILTITGKGNKKYELTIPNNEFLIKQFIAENF